MAEPFKAFATKDRAQVIMVRGSWRYSVRVQDLPSWVALYRGLRDRAGGKYAAIHGPVVEVLEKLAKSLGLALPPEPQATKGGRK